MVGIEDIRRRVMDDAEDLIKAISFVNPLIVSGQLYKLGVERKPIGEFLRKILARNVVLIATRLHERHGEGRTGHSASIPALLEYSKGQLPNLMIDAFDSDRKALVDNLERHEISFNDLYSLRTAMVAHSVHPRKPLSDKLYYSSILDFALGTYELATTIDGELVKIGMPEYWKWSDLREDWIKKGQSFWSELIED